jgi:Ni,Fe-hydrogenase III large subunit
MSSVIRNGSAVELAHVPRFAPDTFADVLEDALRSGARAAALFGVPEARLASPAPGGRLRLFAVLARESDGTLGLLSTTVQDRFRSLTAVHPQLHRFEREIYEQWGAEPDGHPWLKPVRFESQRTSLGQTLPPTPVAGVTDFFRVGGSEIHEVAVGPVHAGIIEPGHFRFQCHGEIVYHLEIALGYQHRGVERALEGGPGKRTLHHVETLAGDTTVGHALAYARAVEALSATEVPQRAQAVRAIALELERLANHAGDLGALAGDVAFLPTSSYCGAIRGDFLNLTALVCGSRFGRSLVAPGGVGFDLDPDRTTALVHGLERAVESLESAVDLLFHTPSVLARFSGVGTLPVDICRDMGIVGPAARAASLPRDVRAQFPLEGDPLSRIAISTSETGDVLARARVRWAEAQRSVDFVRDLALALPSGPVRSAPAPQRPNAIAVSLVEGWRGEICHVAVTGSDGRFAVYKVVDPSFHNWAGLALALRDEQISDFPLCNKSFNLSYCGQDL